MCVSECKNTACDVVQKANVYVFLLKDSSFRGRYEEKSYMVYAGTGSTRCVASVDFRY